VRQGEKDETKNLDEEKMRMKQEDENTFKGWNDIPLISQIFLRARKNDPWDMIYESDEFIRFAEDYVGVSLGWGVKILRFHLVYYERTKQLLPAYYFDIDRWRAFTKQPRRKDSIPYPCDVELVLTSLDRFVKYEQKKGELDVGNRMQWVLEKAIHEGFLEKPTSPCPPEQRSTVRIYLAGQADDLRKIIKKDYTTFSLINTIAIWGEISKTQWVEFRRKYNEICQTLSDLVDQQFWTKAAIKMDFLAVLFKEYEELHKKGIDSNQIYAKLGSKYKLKPQTVKTYLHEARFKLPIFHPRLGFVMSERRKQRRIGPITERRRKRKRRKT
jgi:hypothetical protein